MPESESSRLSNSCDTKSLLVKEHVVNDNTTTSVMSFINYTCNSNNGNIIFCSLIIIMSFYDKSVPYYYCTDLRNKINLLTVCTSVILKTLNSLV